jgi:hypothetical protein
MITLPTELTTFMGGMGVLLGHIPGWNKARSIVQNNLKGNLLEAKLLLVWVSLPTSMGFHVHIYAHDIHPHTHIPYGKLLSLALHSVPI